MANVVYALTVLYLAGVYVRPGEIVPGWDGIPFVAILAAMSLVAMVAAFLVKPRPIWNLPQDWFVLAFLLAIVFSSLASGLLDDALRGLLDLTPAVFCYFLIRSAAISPRRLRWIGYTLVALTLFQAGNGIAQFHTGAGLGDVSALDMSAAAAGERVDAEGEARAEIDVTQANAEVDASDEASNEASDADADPSRRREHEVRRIRGTGIFNDPNDLALAFVVVIPFVAGPLLRRHTATWSRVVAAIVMVPLLLALYYTNSRGGMLGLGAALLPSAYRRFGKIAGPMVATIGIVALIALGPSRMSAMDASETSAQGRVSSWWEGLEMFKSRPLFGIGYDRYTKFNELVAHNSFVHTLAELGLFGAFCFVGMGYWFFVRVRVENPDGQAAMSSLRAWGDDLRQGGLGLTVCAMFLSRQYNVLPFIWLAMGSSYRALVLADQHARPHSTPRVRVPLPEHLLRIAALTCGAIGCVYVAVRVLSLWSE